MDVQIDDRAIRRALQRLQRQTRQMRPVFASIGEELIPSHEKRWAEGVDAQGKPWTPLKPATLKRKRTNRMLFEEGDLLRGPVYRASNQVLAFGISDFKAPFHQFGTTRGLPARPLLGLSKQDQQGIIDIILDAFDEALHG